MKLRYLCPNHREWLFASTQRAEYYWQMWVDTADYYCQNNQVDQAIPFLGCAYELAEFLLSNRRPSQSLALSRFSYSSLLLAMAYSQEGDSEAQSCVIRQAQDRLAMERVVPGMSEYVSSCMQMLLAHGDQQTNKENCVGFQVTSVAVH